MHSRKTTTPKSVAPKDGPSESAHKNPLQTSQSKLAESVLREGETIEESADSRRTAIPRAAERPNLGRHAAKCRICTHAQRQEIEDDFVAWKSPAQIARDYGLADRSSMYRHAHALNLFPKRRRNMRAALELIIEGAGHVKPTAGAILAAVQVCAKLNARGQLIEREETVNLDELFEQMNSEELGTYAKHGILPRWFQEAIGAAECRSSGGTANG